MSQQMPTLVLVHGGNGSSRNWSNVIAALKPHNIPTLAVDLPSVAKDPSNLSNLGDLFADAETIHAAIASLPPSTPIILVAHSFAGASVTQAASADLTNIKRIIYITASVPRPGTSLAESFSEFSPKSPDWVNLDQETFTVTLKLDEAAIDSLYSPELRGDPKVLEIVRSAKPQHMKGLMQVPTVVGWKEHPATFVVLKNDRAFEAEGQRRLAQMMGADVVELEETHAGFLAYPEKMVEVLVKIAKESA
ncbi:hypothetical protein HK104_005073 [Borealophlyctis nickersoniae]|nr:hypothetical protein HK104_005073 [Borealophlyctis nickersoniae]